mmetsp:Transcript_5341/g.15237  ORF Transcript_5341/g.15237 Transcript_5341/m.15237 type:complete len:225 (+) Transcript_5341:574-1248(+)
MAPRLLLHRFGNDKLPGVAFCVAFCLIRKSEDAHSIDVSSCKVARARGGHATHATVLCNEDRAPGSLPFCVGTGPHGVPEAEIPHHPIKTRLPLCGYLRRADGILRILNVFLPKVVHQWHEEVWRKVNEHAIVTVSLQRTVPPTRKHAAQQGALDNTEGRAFDRASSFASNIEMDDFLRAWKRVKVQPLLIQLVLLTSQILSQSINFLPLCLNLDPTVITFLLG